MSTSLIIGTFKWINNEKGFGLLSNGDEDFFFHKSNAEDKELKLTLSDYYSFKRGYDQKKERLTALEVEIVSEPSLEYVYVLLNQSSYQVTVKDKNGLSRVNILREFLFYLFKNHKKEKFEEEFIRLINKLEISGNEKSVPDLLYWTLTLFINRIGRKSELYDKEFIQDLVDSVRENASKRITIILWKERLHWLKVEEDGLRYEPRDDSTKDLWIYDQDLLDNHDLLDYYDVLSLKGVNGVSDEVIEKLKNTVKPEIEIHSIEYFEKLFERTKKGFISEVECYLAVKDFESLEGRVIFKVEILSVLINKRNSTLKKAIRGEALPPNEPFTKIHYNDLINLLEREVSDFEKVLMWNKGYYEAKSKVLPGGGSKINEPFDLSVLIDFPDKVDLEKIRSLSFTKSNTDIVLKILERKYTAPIDYDVVLELCEFAQMTPDISKKLYVIIRDKISDDVIFKIWKNTEFVIDTRAEDIIIRRGKSFANNAGYIPKDIFLSHVDEIGIKEVKRVQSYYKHSDDKSAFLNLLYGLLEQEILFETVNNIIDLIADFDKTHTKALVKMLLKNHFDKAYEELILYKNIQYRLGFSAAELLNLTNHKDITDRCISVLEKHKNEVPEENLASILSSAESKVFEKYLGSFEGLLTDSTLFKILTDNYCEEKLKEVIKYWSFDDRDLTYKLINKFKSNYPFSDAFQNKLSEVIYKFSSDVAYKIHKVTGFTLNEDHAFELIPDQSNRDKIDAILKFNKEKVLGVALKNWNFSDSETTEELLRLLNQNEIESHNDFYEELIKSLDKLELAAVIEVHKKIKSLHPVDLIKSKLSIENYTQALGIDEEVNKLLKQWFSEKLKHFRVGKIFEIMLEAESKGLFIMQLNFPEWIMRLGKSEFLDLFDSLNQEILNKINSIDFEESLTTAIELGLSNEYLLMVLKRTKSINLKKFALKNIDYESNDLTKEEYRAIDGKGFNSGASINLELPGHDTGTYHELLNFIHTSNEHDDLKKSILYTLAHTQKFLPRTSLQVAKEKIPELINEFLYEVKLSEVSYSVFANLILNEPDLLEDNLVKPGSDFHILNIFLRNPTSDQNIDAINTLLKDRFYSFQLPLYKSLTYQFYRDEISRNDLYRLLNDIKGVQISALLYKLVILHPTSDRKQMMSNMNKVLKRHFSLLEREGLNKQIYEQVFSLKELVNKCNGRKSLDGNFWNEGGIQRYYVEDAKNLSYSNEGDENIYCEGRYWKQTPIYDSETNKFSGKKCNVYWCRNKVCMGVNDENHFDKPFEEWTLNDVNKLFNVGLDQLAFSHIAGWLNRMNSIFDSLNCRSCNNLLRPLNFVPNQLGYYAVPLFQCVNHSCVKFEKKIRFTHCRGCGKILDSRDCKTCSDCNWLICDDSQCGQCGCGADHNPRYVQYPEA